MACVCSWPFGPGRGHGLSPRASLDPAFGAADLFRAHCHHLQHRARDQHGIPIRVCPSQIHPGDLPRCPGHGHVALGLWPAWGLGLGRIISEYWNITDIRELYKNDIKQLREQKIFMR